LRNPVDGMDKSDISRKSTKKIAASVCVFCGSSFGNDPAYSEAAKAIGAGIAKMGFSLVFGGGGLGLMGDVARAVLDGGQDIQGIMPAFLQALEPGVSPQEKLIVTPHMQERKTLMLGMSDAFIVLPGGMGTFDEFFEVVVEAQLGVHTKPIIVVNVKGYFDPLDTMLHAIVEKGFAKESIFKVYYLADGAEAALEILEGALNAPPRS
jgi:uncharacterized protein (TIGR00730 family)